MAERRGVRVDKQEEEIGGAGAGSESVERVMARLERGQLLALEIRLGGLRAVISQSYADNLLPGRGRRCLRAFGLAGHAIRNQSPGQFLHLRVRIHPCRSEEYFELPNTIWKHLLLQLREPLHGARFFTVRTPKLADFLRAQRNAF